MRSGQEIYRDNRGGVNMNRNRRLFMGLMIVIGLDWEEFKKA
jgi:hypothetical protein